MWTLVEIHSSSGWCTKEMVAVAGNNHQFMPVLGKVSYYLGYHNITGDGDDMHIPGDYVHVCRQPMGIPEVKE